MRALAEFLDGQFPPDIELPALQATMKEYVAQKNLSDSEIQQQLAPIIEKYTKAYYYINRLRRMMEISHNHYTGKGIKLGDSETSVMWRLPKDSANYRVIYGDMRVADVESENLPDIPWLNKN